MLDEAANKSCRPDAVNLYQHMSHPGLRRALLCNLAVASTTAADTSTGTVAGDWQYLAEE